MTTTSTSNDLFHQTAEALRENADYALAELVFHGFAFEIYGKKNPRIYVLLHGRRVMVVTNPGSRGSLRGQTKDALAIQKTGISTYKLMNTIKKHYFAVTNVK